MKKFLKKNPEPQRPKEDCEAEVFFKYHHDHLEWLKKVSSFIEQSEHTDRLEAIMHFLINAEENIDSKQKEEILDRPLPPVIPNFDLGFQYNKKSKIQANATDPYEKQITDVLLDSSINEDRVMNYPMAFPCYQQVLRKLLKSTKTEELYSTKAHLSIDDYFESLSELGFCTDEANGFHYISSKDVDPSENGEVKYAISPLSYQFFPYTRFQSMLLRYLEEMKKPSFFDNEENNYKFFKSIVLMLMDHRLELMEAARFFFFQVLDLPLFKEWFQKANGGLEWLISMGINQVFNRFNSAEIYSRFMDRTFHSIEDYPFTIEIGITDETGKKKCQRSKFPLTQKVKETMKWYGKLFLITLYPEINGLSDKEIFQRIYSILIEDNKAYYLKIAILRLFFVSIEPNNDFEFGQQLYKDLIELKAITAQREKTKKIMSPYDAFRSVIVRSLGKIRIMII